MKDLAIVCDVMKNEFMKYRDAEENNIDCIFMEQHLHNTPDLMKIKLQEAIDSAGESYGRIILAYGLCSNGVVGLRSGTHEILIPKVDDCISLFLGSKERYLEEFRKDPATYYLCKGWIEYGGDPYRGYLLWTGQDDKIPREWIRHRETYGRRYDNEMAKFLFIEMMKNYSQVTLIDNDDIEDIHMEYATDMVDFMSSMLDRKISLKIIKGSTAFLEKLVKYQYDKVNFLRFEPGMIIRQEDFISRESQV
jgi:hypothetical protein